MCTVRPRAEAILLKCAPAEVPLMSIADRWKWWRDTLGKPKFVCAPMVLQSELPFRMLIRRHGVDLCYSPMIPAKEFLACPADGPSRTVGHPETGKPDTQAAFFTTCAADRPLLAQIGGNDPDEVLAVALLLQDRVDGIDLNFGCPQRCAQRDGYGAFLMDEPETVRVLVVRPGNRTRAYTLSTHFLVRGSHTNPHQAERDTAPSHSTAQHTTPRHAQHTNPNHTEPSHTT